MTASGNVPDDARAARVIGVPEVALVVLIGPSGAGKSTFARTHFAATEIVSSDVCRGLVSDDDNDQAATGPAFELLHTIVTKRLEYGRLTVVDATSVQAHARASLLALAKAQHALAVAIVFDLPRSLCEARNTTRPDRDFGPHVIRQQHQQLRRSIRGLQKEGFHRVFTLRSEAEVDAVRIRRDRLWTDKRDEHGPFDVIGDVHGCHDELVALVRLLGYPLDDGEEAAGGAVRIRAHPDGRRLVFLGDLVDRGPEIPAVLRTVMGAVANGVALCIPGNHENKLGRALQGRRVQTTHGLAATLEQLAQEPPAFSAEVGAFLKSLVSHYVLDDGRLVVAHAGLPEKLQGRSSGAVRSFALYGETSGETDEYGRPVRYAWADDYRGKALVVYGHTPVEQALFVNNTVCVDTGCVFGGRLTALRYPERELVSVPAARVYYEPSPPLGAPGAGTPTSGTAQPLATASSRPPGLLDISDVLGPRIVSVSLLPSVTIREEHAVTALEVLSRFACDPRWLVYLPPTMAPAPTASAPGLLEHPAPAFADFRREGVHTVVCEEKHMGSRAVVVVCRDAEVAERRFGIAGSRAAGACTTRTGRPFFADESLEVALLDRVRAAVGRAGLWDELATDWLVLDAELLPWSLKAGDLLRRQYAAVGASSRVATASALDAVRAASARGVEVGELAERAARRHDAARAFTDAYRRYCWTVDGLDGISLAPFQVLAGEGEVHARRSHLWHLALAARLVEADPVLFRPTPHLVVALGDGSAAGEATGDGDRDGVGDGDGDGDDDGDGDADDIVTEDVAIAWWQARTEAGGEGMVVKPVQPVTRTGGGTGGAGDPRGGPAGRLVQPGIKCRGREYLRIIYGPDYTAPDQLDRLRQRRLGHKRSLALREFALGIEGLDRFVAGEPLHRVHECVFGVLALESEPVDPRL